MPLRSKIIAIAIGAALVFVIFELVRRRRLSEEYSWLWMLTGAVIFILAVLPDLLTLITRAIGAVFPVSTLFFFALVFLILIALDFSVKLSTLENKNSKLAQKLAILESSMQEARPATDGVKTLEPNANRGD